MAFQRIAAWSLLSLAVAEESTEAGGECEFDNAPVGVGYFWDPTCAVAGGLGCNGDSKNVECRLCGIGDYTNPCPPSACKFAQHPYLPYYWDEACEMGMLGCNADGMHSQCRFCGDFPYSSIRCPEGAAPPLAASCAFDVEPAIPVFWEPGCVDGMHGCNADGVNMECRHCGQGEFSHIHCPGSQVCTGFGNIPTVPYYYDPDCTEGMTGCDADGVHVQCRFCGEDPFEAVPCPEPLAGVDICRSTLGNRTTAYFWDEGCESGQLGCFADGRHAQCRFCGSGSYSNITCPEASSGNLRGR